VLGRGCFEQVGAFDGAVSRVASALGVGWATIMRIVTTRGEPIIEDPARLDAPRAIGVDETAFVRATGGHPTRYATGIADLTPGRPARRCDVVAGRSGVVLAAWLRERDDEWTAQIATASLDPFRGPPRCIQQLPQAVRVLDPFHVTKLGLTTLDRVRRRVQQDIHRHRGHRGDPLCGIGRILRRRADGSPSGPGVGCGPDCSPATRAGRSPPAGPSPRTRCAATSSATPAPRQRSSPPPATAQFPKPPV
jgi:transposase